MRLSRRRLIVAAAALGATGAGGARAQVLEPSVPMASLMAPGPLADIVIGAENAPVTIVEYAAPTCPHCGHFHKDVYPELRRRYIDSGKVKFMMREFILNQLDLAAWMISRGLGDARRNEVIDLLFDTQETWVRENPIAEIYGLVNILGFSQENFAQSLQDKAIYDAVIKTASYGSETLGVNATPTFFVNGLRQVGAAGIEDLDRLIAPLLDQSGVARP